MGEAMLRKELWLANKALEGSEDQWKEAVAEYELGNAGFQYQDVLMTDDLILDEFTKAEATKAEAEELVIILPQDMENVQAADQSGRKYILPPGLIRWKLTANRVKRPVRFGVMAKRDSLGVIR